jgi:tetratricopeptide (TPR) repeat protein
VTFLNNLGIVYDGVGRSREAVDILEKVRDYRVQQHGREDPDTLKALSNLGTAYIHLDRNQEAAKLFNELSEIYLRKFGPEHSGTLTTLHNLAVAYTGLNRVPEAIELFEQVVARRLKRFGPNHPDTLMTQGLLAKAYDAAGRTPEAVKLLEDVYDRQRKRDGADHLQTILVQSNLGGLYWRSRQFDKAAACFEEAVRRMMEQPQPDEPSLITWGFNVAVNQYGAGRTDEALATCEKWLARARLKLGSEHKVTRFGLKAAAEMYTGVQEFQKAAPLWRELLESWPKTLPRETEQRASLLATYGFCLLKTDQFAEAEPLLRECQAIREKSRPDVWTTFNGKSMLGGALLGRARSVSDGIEKAILYAEAEPLLLAGYEGMKQRQKTIPPNNRIRIAEATERLVQLYEATGKKDEAAKWRQEHEAVKAAAKP